MRKRVELDAWLGYPVISPQYDPRWAPRNARVHKFAKERRALSCGCGNSVCMDGYTATAELAKMSSLAFPVRWCFDSRASWPPRVLRGDQVVALNDVSADLHSLSARSTCS